MICRGCTSGPSSAWPSSAVPIWCVRNPRLRGQRWLFYSSPHNADHRSDRDRLSLYLKRKWQGLSRCLPSLYSSQGPHNDSHLGCHTSGQSLQTRLALESSCSAARHINESGSRADLQSACSIEINYWISFRRGHTVQAPSCHKIIKTVMNA